MTLGCASWSVGCDTDRFGARRQLSLALISHTDCWLHDNGDGHPESPARLDVIEKHLTGSDLAPHLTRYMAPLAQIDDLLRVHDKSYVDGLFALAAGKRLVRLDPDTVLMTRTLPAALRAAGAALHAVDLVMNNDTDAAFCAVRPPGHHAGRASAKGFFIFNNVAVGAAYAAAKHGLERIAIVDFDVHRGNGTEDIFRVDRRILYCSSYQHPHYPWSSEPSEMPHCAEFRLAPGSNGKLFRNRIADCWVPALAVFRPQLIMVSTGFDGHAEDAMSDVWLVDDDYRWVSEQLKRLADMNAEGRIVSVLEGGYALDALGRGVVAHLSGLIL